MTSPELGRRLRAAAAALILAALAGCATQAPIPARDTPALPTPTAAIETPIAATPPAAPSTVALPSPTPASPPAAPSAVAIDPLRPDAPPDRFDEEPGRHDLWQRVRKGFAMPDLDTDLVRDRERWYATRPDYVQRMTERGSRYLFHIVEEVEKRGMPTELALLPFIESAFNPQAMSSAKASGMWQFIPSTGRHFDLTQNIFRDDRRDVLASTRAALDYLARLHGMFGDWHLALAAYNWGEGSVSRAIARNRSSGLPTDYLSLKMPNETQYYVPKLQAVKNIIARPEDFGLELPVVDNHPYFLSVAIRRDIDVDLAARLAGMRVDDFRALNPQMNKPVILAAGTPQVLLPYDNANQFVRRIDQHRGPMATWTAWIAPSTMRTAEAARRVGMTEAELREVNRIPPRMLVKAGSTLLVERGDHRHADVPEHVADNASMALAPDVPPLRRLALKAGRRDTVASIARRFKVNASQVAQWNGVGARAGFKAGQTIVVYVASARSVVAKGSARRGVRVIAKAAPAPARVVASARKSARTQGLRVSAAKAPVRLARTR